MALTAARCSVRMVRLQPCFACLHSWRLAASALCNSLSLFFCASVRLSPLNGHWLFFAQFSGWRQFSVLLGQGAQQSVSVFVFWADAVNPEIVMAATAIAIIN